MLPEIIISCNKKGLIRIGDTLLGEVNEENYQSFIGAGSFYLSYTPISGKEVYAPITVKVSVENGVPIFECPYINIFNYKNNTFLMDLEPPCLAAHTLPVCLMYKRAEDRFIVSLIKQNCHYVVIEDERKQLPDGFFIVQIHNTPLMDTGLISDVSVVILCDSKAHTYVFVKGEKGFYKALALEADEYKIEQDKIIIKKTTSFGHVVTNVYGVKNKTLALIDSNYEANPLPVQKENLIEDFLECVKYGVEKKALSYLSGDLQLSFSDLKEFLGEFSEFKTSPFEENAYALINRSDDGVYLVNRFSFEILGSKIDNIEEL